MDLDSNKIINCVQKEHLKLLNSNLCFRWSICQDYQLRLNNALAKWFAQSQCPAVKLSLIWVMSWLAINLMGGWCCDIWIVNWDFLCWFYWLMLCNASLGGVVHSEWRSAVCRSLACHVFGCARWSGWEHCSAGLGVQGCSVKSSVMLEAHSFLGSFSLLCSVGSSSLLLFFNWVGFSVVLCQGWLVFL